MALKKCAVLYCSRQALFYVPNKTLQISNCAKSQIGFLPNNCTANHVFTLRTLIDNYVHNHNEKIYVCLVDFKKAFDSVWNDGFLNKLLQINVSGCFYNLIKSFYHNSSSSIKIANYHDLKQDYEIASINCLTVLHGRWKSIPRILRLWFFRNVSK